MTTLPEGLKELSEVFFARGFKLFLVGGYVRNSVLGISGGDLDICSRALPGEAAFFLREKNIKVIEKAPELGTIEIHIMSGGKKRVFEHTTFRKDFYPEGGEHRPDRVEFTEDMKEDAARRDFTVNALYLDLDAGEVIDPTGKGSIDIKEKKIRAAADDPDITIRDDGLRIMRMVRFAAELGFAVDPGLMECARKRAYLLADISAERKRDELKKILLADTKYPALSNRDAPAVGLELLKDSGALEVVLPRLCEGEGIEQAEAFHRYDVLDHGIHACGAAPAKLELRLAALLHDIGKPAALREGGNMYGHDRLGEALARQELDSLRFENSIKAIVLPLIRNHMFDLEGRAKPKTIRRRAVKLGKELFAMLIELRRADVWGSGLYSGPVDSAGNWQKEVERMEAENVPWSVKELAITGDEVMSLLDTGPSPAIGKILELLFKECVAHPQSNNFETLKKLTVSHRNLLI